MLPATQNEQDAFQSFIKLPQRTLRRSCRRVSWVTAAVALGLWLGSTACDRGGNRAQQQANLEEATTPVETVPVTARALDRTLTVLGSFAPKQEAELSAKVAGQLKATYVDLGSEVQAGQTLVEIDPRDYELNLLQAKAALAQARALLGLPPDGDDDDIELDQTAVVREARAVYEQAEANRARAQRLREEGIVASSEFDGVEAAYQVAANRFEVAMEQSRQRRANVAQRRVEVEIAAQQLADATVVAPFDGQVQRRYANAGQYVRPGDTLLHLVQVNPLRLRMEVPEREAARVQVGQAVRFRATGSDEERGAEVTRVGPALDRASRILAIEADVANDGGLHPGSFAEVRITVQREPGVLLVPERALRTFAGMEKVFVMVDGKAEERDVATGQREGDWVELTEGVKEGERVILDPGNLRNGTPVVERSGA